MTNIEPQPTAPQVDNVTRAVVALTAFADLDREGAARLLRIWKHFGELTGPDVEEILRHFPTAGPSPDESHFDVPDGFVR